MFARSGDDNAAELQAICESCLQPIDDGEGAVWVEPPAPRPPGRDMPVPHDRRSGPVERAAWHVTHDVCAPPPGGYRIDVERIRTWAAYLHWTGHLMGKEWIADTNWDALVLDSLNPTSTSAGGIRPVSVRDPGHRNIGD